MLRQTLVLIVRNVLLAPACVPQHPCWHLP